MLKRGLTLGSIAVTVAWFTLTAAARPQSTESKPPVTATTASDGAFEPRSSCFGKSIAGVAFPGTPEQDQPMLHEVARLKTGDRLDKAALQNALKALYATGRFASLRAECDVTPGNTAQISFVSAPNFFVGRVDVEGAPGPPGDSQVVNASKLQLGDSYSTAKLDTAVQNIQHLMQENGYYQSSISHAEQEETATRQISILFTIHSGDPARVGKITLEGNALYSQGQIEDIAHLHPGDTVKAQTTSNAIERIRKSLQKKDRWLAQVEISDSKFIPATKSVDYTLRIDPGPVVSIAVQGFKISQGTMKRTIPVYEENALDDDLLNEGRRNLLTYMESRGYFGATVDLQKGSDPDNQVRVVYQINPGPRHKVARVEISGNKYFRDEDLRPGMQVQPASMLLSHGRYSDAMLRSDVRSIENKYRANGFADVHVETQVKDNFGGQKNQIAVYLHVIEGAQTLVGSFQITGNSTLKAESLPPLNTQPGQPFSDVNVAQDRDILLNYYFDQGFPNASLDVSAKPASDHRMDVAFRITEGERVYVGQVMITGLEFTRPYVVGRDVEMKPGDPLSQSSLLNTQQNLYDLGIFSQVDTAVQNPEGVEPRKNVLVQVREAKRYTFNYGVGFEFQTGQPSNSTQPLGSNGVSPLASFDVTRLNFRGRDHTITFLSSVGALQQRGLLSYQAPRWFNNPNLRLTLTAFFDHTLDVTTFTSQRLEGLIQAEQIVTKKLDGTPISLMTYRFNYRLVKANLNPNFPPDEVPILSQPVRVGEPGFSFIRNRRDNDLETTRGSYISVDGGVASKYFGSEADFSRIMVQDATYYPFGKRRGSSRQFVFARSTRVGVEIPLGNTVITQPGEPLSSNPQIPLPELFLMGGGNSHRGFGLNQAGPRNPQSGFPLGGAALFLNNFELRLPPPTLPWVGTNMSFAIFNDMGNVFTDGRHMLDSLLRWHQAKDFCVQPIGTPYVPSTGAARCNYNYINQAIGLGVRYKTPVGPVRFDFGYDLNPTIFPNFTPPSSTNPNYIFAGTRQASPFNVYFSVGQTF
ncbi:MAG TPA: POTRA domain-containing protein [Terriglobales bacterium]